MQRNKGVLEPNSFTNTNQILVVQGIPSPIILTQRDAIPMEMAMIETPDKRRLPSGRNNSGEFNAAFALADDPVRTSMVAWYRMSRDLGQGISPNYKRDGMLTYNRLFEGSPSSEFAGAGRQGNPFKLRLIGLWIMKLEFSEFDMSSDGEIATGTATFCFDDVDPDEDSVGRSTGGLFGG